jgi:hypothetical protein
VPFVIEEPRASRVRIPRYARPRGDSSPSSLESRGTRVLAASKSRAHAASGSGVLRGDASRTRLEDALKTVIAAVHATHEHAKAIGYAMPQLTSEDLRTMANTLIIDGQKGGH